MPTKVTQNQESDLRQPPQAGGPRRVPEADREVQMNASQEQYQRVSEEGGFRAPAGRKRKGLKKAMGALIAGGSTAVGVGFTIGDILF